MRNKLLISGLAFLLIAALIVSASAADVISVSELFNFGGDTQEEVTAAISDAPADASEPDTSAPVDEEAPASDPVQEPAADDTATDNDTGAADDTAPTPDGNTDNSADDTATDNTSADSFGNGQADTPDDTIADENGEAEDVNVPEQRAVIDEVNQAENLIIHITHGFVAVEGGADHITTDIPSDLQAEMAGRTGIIVEVPVYLSGSNTDGGALPLVTNASLRFNATFYDEKNTIIGNSHIIALSPKIGEAFAGATAQTQGLRTTVTYDNASGVTVTEGEMPFITLRYCLPAELVSGELVIGAAANASLPNNTNCSFFGRFSTELEGDTYNIYNVMTLDQSQWTKPFVTISHEHVVNNWEVTTEPTCTTDGEETGTCASAQCPHNSAANPMTRPVAKLGHDFETLGRLEPTCTQDGHIAHKYCGTCNLYFSPDDDDRYSTSPLKDEEGQNFTAASVILGKLGHEFETVEYLAPTCVAEGHVEHQICTRPGCPGGLTFDMDGNQYPTGDELIPIDPANHAGSLREITYVEPNCREGSAGRNQYWYCADCNKYFTDAEGTPDHETTVAEQVIPNNHLFETVPEIEQDCHINEETGTGTDAVAEHQICARDCCEGLVYDMDGKATTMEELTTPFTHMKPADPAEIETVAATWNTDGYIRYICEECGETITEIIPASGDAPSTGSGRYAPNTDDSSGNPVLWAMLIFFGLSLAGLATVTAGRRKYSR